MASFQTSGTVTEQEGGKPTDEYYEKNVRSLTFSDFLNQSRVSVRLRNCISQWIEGGRFPFQTVGDYLDAGESGTELLMTIPNLGKRTAKELDEVIAEALNSDTFFIASSKNHSGQNNSPSIRNASIRALTFPELLDRCHASIRLRNWITRGINEGLFPYASVGDYIDGGKKATAKLRSIPNIGKGTVRELHGFIENGYIKKSQPEKRLELADELEARYPKVFDDMLATYRLIPETEPLKFRQYEKRIKQLLDAPRHAEVCLRRFWGETLEAIAYDLGVTRERVRQIEKKYVSIITNIYTQTWTTSNLAYPNSAECAQSLTLQRINI